MKSTHILYGHHDVFRCALSNVRSTKDGWVPARFTGTRRSIPQRLYAAWLVFIGRADALVWLGDQ